MSLKFVYNPSAKDFYNLINSVAFEIRREDMTKKDPKDASATLTPIRPA